MTDVLLVAGDVEEPAHSLILSLHSAYFKTLFQVFCRTLALEVWDIFLYIASLQYAYFFPFQSTGFVDSGQKRITVCALFLSKSYT